MDQHRIDIDLEGEDVDLGDTANNLKGEPSETTLGKRKRSTKSKAWDYFKILPKVEVDNASANDSFIQFFKEQLLMKSKLLGDGDYLHVRCCAHILNLIVQEGLKVIDACVDEVRECVKYVKGSQVRKERFLASVSHCGLDSRKGLRQDVPTRWNSTYLMLRSSLHYRRAFNHLKLVDSNFSHCPTIVEWEKVEKLCKFLDVFYEATNLFSGTKYPTANLYFPKVFQVEITLQHHLTCDDIFMRSMAVSMYEKFHKYWSDYSTLFAIALVFDPRFKMQFVEFAYKKLYGHDSDDEIMKVKEKLFSLFDEYLFNAHKQSPSLSASASSSSRGGTIDDLPSHTPSGIFDVFEEFDSITSSESLPQKNQLELYLDEPKIDRAAKIDILAYWKAYQYRYPELANFARDVLSVPISTVASESAFSTGGRILDQYRSAMKRDIVEALICCKDWLFGEHVSNDVQLDELTENVMTLYLNENDDQSTTATYID